MEKILKSNPSELVGPASRSVDELFFLQLKFTVTLTCSCLSCTAGLTWSLGGLPPELSDTCLGGIRGSENVCSKVKMFVQEWKCLFKSENHASWSLPRKRCGLSAGSANIDIRILKTNSCEFLKNPVNKYHEQVSSQVFRESWTV